MILGVLPSWSWKSICAPTYWMISPSCHKCTAPKKNTKIKAVTPQLIDTVYSWLVVWNIVYFWTTPMPLMINHCYPMVLWCSYGKSPFLVGSVRHVLLFHILGMSSSQVTFTPSFFRGVGQPPTRLWLIIINHIITIIINHEINSIWTTFLNQRGSKPWNYGSNNHLQDPGAGLPSWPAVSGDRCTCGRGLMFGPESTRHVCHFDLIAMCSRCSRCSRWYPLETFT